VTQSSYDPWARFRFSVVGPLLSSPPEDGALADALQELRERTWSHPTTGDPTRFAFSTIEHWYYTARNAKDPIAALRRAVRKDAGTHRSLSEKIIERLEAQYRAYGDWSFQLHYDNLEALVKQNQELGPLPSYSTITRYMKAHGLLRQKRRGNEKGAGFARARERLERCEVRSYEVEHVGGLWHLDFHTSRVIKVLRPDGTWIKPLLLAILDDYSRLCCHAQFYLAEDTESLVHGFSQAILKRQRPRASLSDNGPAMIAAEFREGLEQLSILHETTLPHSPYQNGKQEHFWEVVEGRFLTMLKHLTDLTLDHLNYLLQAWVEQDYNRRYHREIACTPLERYLSGHDVSQPSPSPEELRDAFRRCVPRKVRRSDLTLMLEGRRYEVPQAFRHFERLSLAYARWDLGRVHIVDQRTRKNLARLFPLDRNRNASGERRALEPLDASCEITPPQDLPPLLKQCVADYAASGLPPAYIPTPDPEEKTP
jgi:putative transposase